MAQASHAQGGDLRYEALGNNRYRITCRFFRDCSGIDAPNLLSLSARVGTTTTACASTAPQNFTTTLLRSTIRSGTQYCATVSGICTTNGPDNYEEVTYLGTVTLPANEWVLSVTETVRPSLANIPGSTDLYFQATLDNRNGLANTSPDFGSLPAVFVAYNQSITLAAAAFDLDGDSLAYSLASPLDGCNTPSTYLSPPPSIAAGAGCTTTLTAPMPASYSPAYPLPSVLTTGSCPQLQGTPAFSFNAATGAMRFRPAAYTPNPTGSPSLRGLNRYAVVVKIEEWRRVNGTYRNVGSARREMFLNVYDCGLNQMPRFAGTMQVQNQAAVSTTTVIPVQSGATATLLLNATDDNAGQQLTFTANHLGVPGVSAQQTGGNTLALSFTPPADLPDGVYHVTVRAEDNNCPVKGFEMQTLAFRVFGAPLSTRTRAATTLRPAYPNPFAEQVTFRLLRPATGQQVDIVDQLGRVVEQLRVPAGAANLDAELSWRPAPGTPAGVYLARFPEGRQTVRLLYLAR